MTNSTTQDPALQDRRGPQVSVRALTIGICVITVSIAFEAIAVATAMPAAARDLDGIGGYAWAFSIFVIGMLFATVVSGRVCDAIGPAKPLAIGLVIFAGGLLLAGFAGSWELLVAARLVQGMASGVINTAMYVSIAAAVPSDARPRVMTYLSTAWVVPGVAGPAVSAWITSHLSWHWVFFADLPLVLAGGLLVAPTLRAMARSGRPEQTERPSAPVPLWAAALAALSAAAIQYAGQRLDLLALIPAATGVAGLAISLPRLMPPRFIRLGRGLPSVILTRILIPGAFFGSEAFIPLMLVEHRDLELVFAGAVLTVGTVGWFLGAWVQSQRWMTLPRHRVIVLGTVSTTVGVALVAVAVIWPGSWIGLVGIAWVFAAFGMGLTIANTSLATMAFSADSEQGRNASSLNLGDALGSGLFVGVSGAIFAALRTTGDLALTFGVLFAVMAVVALGSAAASTRIGPLPDSSR